MALNAQQASSQAGSANSKRRPRYNVSALKSVLSSTPFVASQMAMPATTTASPSPTYDTPHTLITTASSGTPHRTSGDSSGSAVPHITQQQQTSASGRGIPKFGRRSANGKRGVGNPVPGKDGRIVVGNADLLADLMGSGHESPVATQQRPQQQTATHTAHATSSHTYTHAQQSSQRRTGGSYATLHGRGKSHTRRAVSPIVTGDSKVPLPSEMTSQARGSTDVEYAVYSARTVESSGGSGSATAVNANHNTNGTASGAYGDEFFTPFPPTAPAVTFQTAQRHTQQQQQQHRHEQSEQSEQSEQPMGVTSEEAYASSDDVYAQEMSSGAVASLEDSLEEESAFMDRMLGESRSLASPSYQRLYSARSDYSSASYADVSDVSPKASLRGGRQQQRRSQATSQRKQSATKRRSAGHERSRARQAAGFRVMAFQQAGAHPELAVPSHTESERRRDNEQLVQTEADALVYSKRARRVEYKPKTLAEFKRAQPKEYKPLGSLGVDLNDEKLVAKRAQQLRMKDFARNLREINRRQISRARANAPPPKPPSPKQPSVRDRALEFAKNVPKPKTVSPSATASDVSPSNGIAFGSGVQRGLKSPKRDEAVRARASVSPRARVGEVEALEAAHDAMATEVDAIRREFGL